MDGQFLGSSSCKVLRYKCGYPRDVVKIECPRMLSQVALTSFKRDIRCRNSASFFRNMERTGFFYDLFDRRESGFCVEVGGLDGMATGSAPCSLSEWVGNILSLNPCRLFVKKSRKYEAAS